MNRTLQLVVLLMAVLALALHGVTDAACRVKPDASTGKDADAPANGTASANKIAADAPSKRLINKIAFDVVDEEAVKRKRLANKIAFDVPNSDNDKDDDIAGSDNSQGASDN